MTKTLTLKKHTCDVCGIVATKLKQETVYLKNGWGTNIRVCVPDCLKYAKDQSAKGRSIKRFVAHEAP